MEGLQQLTEANPMDLLAEKPNNYLGAFRSYDLADFKTGSWFYDDQAEILYYLVRNQVYFDTMLDKPGRAGFKIFPVYSDRISGTEEKKYISGLSLKPLEPYKWISPWENN